MIEYLTLPGYGGSGPRHWQTHWDRIDPAFTRVAQKDWDHPVRADWVKALDAAADKAGDHLILVAHGLGCLLVAHWAAVAPPRNHAKVKGAFLVGVTDPGGPAFPNTAEGFAPVPLNPLPFPSFIVAGSDDPHGSPAFARLCARSWGGGIVVVGAKGLINAESNAERGLGAWEEGRRLLDSFTLL
jgi:predicted alpha/beta hydrolase family esterase